LGVGGRGAGRGVVDLVVVDNRVQVLAGGVVDGRLEHVGDVVRRRQGRLGRAAGGRAGAHGIGAGGAVGAAAGVVVDLRVDGQADDVPLHAGRRHLVHARGDAGGALAAVPVERADVDQRRAAQHDGLAG